MLLDTLTNDLNTALKSGDKLRTQTLRFLIAAVKKYDIDTYLPGSSDKLSEADVTKIINNQVKTHKESVTAFTKGRRQDLVDKETAELDILKKYLPPELSDGEIKNIAASVMSQGLTNFGPVMGAVMKEVDGRASGDRVQKIVKQLLN